MIKKGSPSDNDNSLFEGLFYSNSGIKKSSTQTTKMIIAQIAEDILVAVKNRSLVMTLKHMPKVFRMKADKSLFFY